MMFTLSGRVKPQVRTSARQKFVDPQYQEYLSCKGHLQLQATIQMQGEKYTKIGRTPVAVMVALYYQKGQTMDLDNQLKTVLDALNGVVYEDDRWINVLLAERFPNQPEDVTVIEIVSMEDYTVERRETFFDNASRIAVKVTKNAKQTKKSKSAR